MSTRLTVLTRERADYLAEHRPEMTVPERWEAAREWAELKLQDEQA